MKLDSSQVELIQRVGQVINGLIIVVKEDGLIRQVTSMDKSRQEKKVDNKKKKV